MTFAQPTRQIALLVGLAVTPPRCVGPAAGHDTSPLPVTGRPSSVPILAEHRYRLLAKVRPLLFWITNDDVGRARVSWRGDGGGAFGIELLIGSDPERELELFLDDNASF